jgi:hypothetical protein
MQRGLDTRFLAFCSWSPAQKWSVPSSPIWKSKLDWPFQVAEGSFRDLDGRVGLVFAVTPTKVLSFGKGPYSQTRYRFTAAASGA